MGKQKYYETEYYIDGNTIRKRQVEVQGRNHARLNTAYQPIRKECPAAVPDRKREAREDKKRQKAAQTWAAQRWDLPSLLVIIGALAVTFLMCISYLEAQETITAMSKKVASLESEIMTLKNENDAAYSRIDSYVDLQYIYDVAVNELGMVHAKDNQVVPYNSRKSNTVRQYGEIPAETEQRIGKIGR